mmetsp:Transcript_15944/g.34906  ORF Transcript_15944/g.34906 Transcript_15944/m.34906 type:complete len:211 (-) Transcript_15944:1091-1723(-)
MAVRTLLVAAVTDLFRVGSILGRLRLDLYLCRGRRHDRGHLSWGGLRKASAAGARHLCHRSFRHVAGALLWNILLGAVLSGFSFASSCHPEFHLPTLLAEDTHELSLCAALARVSGRSFRHCRGHCYWRRCRAIVQRLFRGSRGFFLGCGTLLGLERPGPGLSCEGCRHRPGAGGVTSLQGSCRKSLTRARSGWLGFCRLVDHGRRHQSG